MQFSELKKEYFEIKESMKCTIDDSCYAHFESHRKILTKMAEIENRAIAVYDFHQMKFILKQDANILRLGYLPNDTDLDDIEKYHQKIHPDDIHFVYETDIMAHKFFHGMGLPERMNYKVIYDFRVRKKDGGYLRFMHQMLVFECDRDGRSWLLLIITDIIEETATNRTPGRYIMNIKTKELVSFDHVGNTKKQLFTKREIEVLKLLGQGIESETIAKRLFISVNTVNNHRQNILGKIGAANSTQVLLFAKRTGLI